MNKRGQFYFMAATIVVAVIIGFISVHNIARTKSIVDVSHIGKELEIESEKVLDYQLYTGNSVLNNFTKNYSKYLKDNTNVIYILENETGDLEVYKYNSSGDKVLYNFYNLNYDLSKGIGKINVEENSINYTFNMREGKDF